MSRKKAQVSLEFLMVTGFIMLVMMGSLSFLLHFAQTSTDEFVTRRVNDIGKKITNNAELLGVYGAPARKVLVFSFPPRVINMSIENDHFLFLLVQTKEGSKKYYGFYSSYNITGNFDERDYVEGKHSFLLQVNETIDEVRVSRWV